jgi:hypothetical protein
MHERRLRFLLDGARERALVLRCRRLHHHTCPAVALAEEDLFPVATRALPPVATDREWS